MIKKLSEALFGLTDRWSAASGTGKRQPTRDDTIAEIAECVGAPELSLEDTPLLSQRLDGLAIDAGMLRERMPSVLDALVQTCSGCRDKERCGHDFNKDANPRGWQSYCANSATLKTLA